MGVVRPSASSWTSVLVDQELSATDRTGWKDSLRGRPPHATSSRRSEAIRAQHSKPHRQRLPRRPSRLPRRRDSLTLSRGLDGRVARPRRATTDHTLTPERTGFRRSPSCEQFLTPFLLINPLAIYIERSLPYAGSRAYDQARRLPFSWKISRFLTVDGVRFVSLGRGLPLLTKDGAAKRGQLRGQKRNGAIVLCRSHRSSPGFSLSG
jgi:hypothetical protein